MKMENRCFVSVVRMVLGSGSSKCCREDKIRICPHCPHDFQVKVSDDNVFYFHWVGKYYVFEVGLLVEGARLAPILYRRVYVSE
jgi:hypothetical protein